MQFSHRLSVTIPALIASLLVAAPRALADDQTVPGAGNAEAIKLATSSPLVHTGRRLLAERVDLIRNVALRAATQQALEDVNYCIAHRSDLTDAGKDAVVAALFAAGLLDAAEAAGFPGGGRAGVFPPVLHDGGHCPRLPQRFYSAPASPGGGHHTYPGGLVVHESFNSLSYQSFADNYRRVFGRSGLDGSAEIDGAVPRVEAGLDQDIVVGAPLWHDWAKAMVLQWNANGSEFAELHIAGTGGHHILGLAETMKLGFAADFVVTQASAHTSPNDSEAKVVGYLRAAAIIARIDPIAKGYLRADASGALRLPAVRRLGNPVDLNAAGRTNFLVEYTLHNLSDGDWILAEPAVDLAELLLSKLAGAYGAAPSDVDYIAKFRNPALSYLSAERIVMLYGNGGISAVREELDRLHRRGVL